MTATPHKTSVETLKIRRMTTRAVNCPLPRPIRTAIGDVPSAPLLLIDIVMDQGVVGRSYLFAYTPRMLRPLAVLAEEMAAGLIGQPAAPQDRYRDALRQFRLLGCNGLLGMIISGIDMALWDACGKAAGLPVATLLGSEPKPIRAYDSYGIVDPASDASALKKSVDDGFSGIKIKLGGGSHKEDLSVVREVRSIIGPDVALMIDYNQSLSAPEAIRRIEDLAQYDPCWIEEPVAAEELAAQATVRASSRVPIQSGESWWFPAGMAAAVAAGACDLAMLDVMRIGGITGWLNAASQAAARGIPLSSHIFVEASAHALALSLTADWLEYVDSAGAIRVDAYSLERGGISARGPGLGMEWDDKAVRQYSI